jgi:hypothetical protein
MKILITGRKETPEGCDYLVDPVLHGLRNTSDIEVIDDPKVHNMYHFKNEKDLQKMYGRGFTIYGTLPDINIDRTNIIQKIKDLYFDFIFIGGAWERPTPYLKTILTCYPKNKLVVLDSRLNPTPTKNLIENTIYFKTALYENVPGVIPISFGFPEEKIQSSLPKIKKDSIVKPAKQWHGAQSYIYTKEQDYYDDYRSSLFGETKKRGQWECLRHYEIMACRCLPYWPSINDCPSTTCISMPKNLIKDVLLLYKEPFEFFNTDVGIKEYTQLESQIFDHFIKNCTTKALVNYIFEKI